MRPFLSEVTVPVGSLELLARVPLHQRICGCMRCCTRRAFRGIGRAGWRAQKFLPYYALASLPDQFDTLVWFDETHATTPLEAAFVPALTTHGGSASEGTSVRTASSSE
jgi:hypothetical protein